MTTTSIVALGVSAVLCWFATSRHRPHATASPASVLDEIVREGGAPGAQYVHLDRDRVMFSHTAGVADVARQLPVTQATVFAGYSTTKTFTAAAVLRMAAASRIDLDAPVSRYLPELGDAAMPTVRQTLQHTGGWANPIPVGWVHPLKDDATFDREAFTRRVLARYGRPGAVGKSFAYSNVGYLVLGEILQRVSGRDLRALLTDGILEPLALADGETLRFALGAHGPLATGYVRCWSLLDIALGWFLDRRQNLLPAVDGWIGFRPLTVDGAAYGGIFGNARGFGRYLQAMLREAPPFDGGLVNALSAPGTLADGRPTPAAHGWFRGQLTGEPYLHHAGGGGGFYCEIRMYPRLGRASVVMFNRSAMSDEKLLDRIDATLVAASDGGTR